jgi:hypothetical protein
MKKLEADDEVIRIDQALGIAWILLPPDPSLGGFRGVSPRVIDEKKFLAAKERTRKGRPP